MTNFTLKDLPVDLTELCIALEAEASEFRWYLDVSSGEVLLVTNEYDPDDHDGLTLPDIENEPERFRRVPAGTPEDTHADMREFTRKIEDLKLRESLELALEAPRPERRFKAVLNWVPGIGEQWHAFRKSRVDGRAREWLRSLGFAPKR